MSEFKAHAESTDIAKIEGLLKAGLYISNTMLVMEKEIVKENDNLTKEVNDIEHYDTADMTEYLDANEKGFGVRASEEMLTEELSNPNSSIFIIRKRKKIVSSLTTWDIDDETVAVENIFTIPSYRNRHFASELLLHTLEEAGRRGMKRARLTVYGDDCEAIAMYHKLGFKITKVLQEFSEY